FFFQAEDGIRDFHVTGVQTCALPISMLKAPFQLFMDFNMSKSEFGIINIKGRDRAEQNIVQMIVQGYFNGVVPIVDHEEGCPLRSEERRVGKECRYRWWRYH